MRADVDKKIGMQPSEITVPYHNAFGSTWTQRLAEWKTADLYVQLLESAEPFNDVRPTLIVKTRAQYDTEQKAGAKKSDPLD